MRELLTDGVSNEWLAWDKNQAIMNDRLTAFGAEKHMEWFIPFHRDNQFKKKIRYVIIRVERFTPWDQPKRRCLLIIFRECNIGQSIKSRYGDDN